MKKHIYSILFVASLTTSFAQAGWLVKQNVKNGKTTILSVESFAKNPKQKIILKSLPEFLQERKSSAESLYQEVLYPTNQLPKGLEKHIKKSSRSSVQDWPGAEVRSLVEQGPLNNRIDLTIVGDGYTLAEKDKFFADAQRITQDLFYEKTFSSYLALFNVHAVFVPSQDSGITDTVNRNTALGLYRSPANSKRAIMPGNTSAIERAISLAPQTDYPILLANDDFYGGLGGRYAITTRSETSGSMVLRHELGHNFGSVGEEYDGGNVYQGANSASSPSRVSWQHWLQDDLKVFEIKFLSGDYVWQPLQGNPYRASFRMPAGDYVFDTRISSVGWSSADDVKVLVDNKETEIQGVYTVDRSFFNFKNTPVFTPGSHSIEIRDNNGDGDNLLAFAQMFANPSDMIKERNFVGAYATYNAWGSKAGYRPTYDTCLMYDMLSKDFCPIDKENMWIRFLDRVDLVDGLEKEDLGAQYKLLLKMPALTGFRTVWSKVENGNETVIAQDVDTLLIDKSITGDFRVYVEFFTPEVRKPGVRFYTVKEFQLRSTL